MSTRSTPHTPRPVSFFEHICTVLREDILSGDLPRGSRITEAFILDRAGVSRTPVREALRRLEAEGLVIATGAAGRS